MDVSYFYSLVSPQGQRKKRACLRCRRTFVSQGAGHRICGACRIIVDHQGLMATALPLNGGETVEAS